MGADEFGVGVHTRGGSCGGAAFAWNPASGESSLRPRARGRVRTALAAGRRGVDQRGRAGPGSGRCASGRRLTGGCRARLSGNNQHTAPCTHHPARCTQHLARCTQYPARCTRHPAPCTRHPARCTRHPEPCTHVANVAGACHESSSHARRTAADRWDRTCAPLRDRCGVARARRRRVVARRARPEPARGRRTCSTAGSRRAADDRAASGTNCCRSIA